LYIVIFFISLIAAFIFALGGVGAAIILIPAMVSMGIPINTAKPIGLFYNTVSLSGATVHNIRYKQLDIKIGIPIITVSFLFASIGAYLSKYISPKIILFLFVLFLFFSGFMFLLKKETKYNVVKDDVPYLQLTLIGCIAGLLSGVLGVGGGGIISPLMLMLGFSPKKIAVTTAFVVPFSSFSGFLTYWALGNVNWKIVIVASIGGVIGANFGTRFMHNKLQSSQVKKILAIILLIMATKLLFKLF